MKGNGKVQIVFYIPTSRKWVLLVIAATFCFKSCENFIHALIILTKLKGSVSKISLKIIEIISKVCNFLLGATSLEN